ncbi:MULTISPECIES: exodeoxyribonuclease V subunit beta [Comamonas]|uniref:exodeoxyribonuclease V subunit beta n=1 Tax=Comamonas TaxID=283 RepID=UPI002579FEFB|nr:MULTISPECIES: exodeoxyribonuclease V subunit beta [Comamonas]
MSTRHRLDAATFPLHGSRLIEASAGTGKTWTIAALYLRLVLGHGGEQGFSRPLMPAEILVMTFTRAATRELSDRIRARLVDAVACFRGQQPVAAHDALLQTLMAAYPEGVQREQAAWRLARAAESMDDAAIFTIDAWCQRMLREHAFDSGNLFEETLESDESQRLLDAVHDYWRQQCYPLNGAQLEVVLGVWKNVDALLADMQRLGQDRVPAAHGAGSLAECVERAQHDYDAAVQALAQGWEAKAQRLQHWLDAQLDGAAYLWDKRKLQPARYTGWLRDVAAWAQDPQHTPLKLSDAAAHRLSPEGMAEACKGSSMDVLLPEEFAQLQQLLVQLQNVQQPAIALRLHAAAQVQARLQWLKRQAGTFGFADMLQRLDTALGSDNGANLRSGIVAQYPVALIDEFQDTSPLQYRLFDRVYRTSDNDPASALLLIGDPKQSIYGFRGADIYSYLRAREATEGRHYVLDVNYRSTQGVVQAVNEWFVQAEQRAGEGAFMFREWEDGKVRNPLPFDPVRAHGRKEVLQSHGEVLPALQMWWYDTQGDNDSRAPVSSDALRQHIAAACAEQIVQWLSDAHVGFAQTGQPLQRLRPRDMAVLVRTGKEATAVRQQLQRRGVASVYLSDQDSVFASAEAQDLQLWLRAVAAPLEVRGVRAGLATRMMGLSLDELAWLASNDEAFDGYSEQLRKLHGVWQRQGVLAMLRQTLHSMQLPARWLAEAGGERRLTNFLHLAELLQNAAATLEGEQALIRWLATQIETPGKGVDEQVVRLESDADLVKIVTVHKSKGLEYPVVFLPFASDFRAYGDDLVRVPQSDGSRHLELSPSDAELAQADTERLREDLRLLYVALTRPRHLLWMGLGALRKGNSKHCVNHESASGYLLNGGEAATAQQWWQALEVLAQSCPDMQLQRLPQEITRSLWRSQESEQPLQAASAYTADFDRNWGIASFSALVRGATGKAQVVLPVAAMRPADDERMAGEVLASKPSLHKAAADAPVWHRFKRGELVGNFIHDQLEWLEGEDFALPADGQGPLAQRLLRRCERAGRSDEAQDVVSWLAAVVHHRLPLLECSLAQLALRLPEMEFWLPLAQLPADRVDALCREHILPGQDRPALPGQRSLHGMLMGFADLVFTHQGRYWVLDYKTNHLGVEAAAYTDAALAQAMLQHRYDVQAALYMLALHRLLQSRLGQGYEPAQHLGGAVYYFLRGLDGPAQAVHHVPPVLALLHALEALLEEVSA